MEDHVERIAARCNGRHHFQQQDSDPVLRLRLMANCFIRRRSHIHDGPRISSCWRMAVVRLLPERAHVDTELNAKDLLNRRMAYFAISRGARRANLHERRG